MIYKPRRQKYGASVESDEGNAIDLGLHGTESQKLFGYKTNDLAYTDTYTINRSDITDNVQPSVAELDSTKFGIEFAAESLLLRNNPSYVIYFEKTGESVPTVEYKGSELTALAVVDNNNEQMNYVSYVIDDLTPETFGQRITLTVKNGDNTGMATFDPRNYIKATPRKYRLSA